MWSPTLLWLVCSSPEGKGDTEQAQLLKTLSAAAGEAKEQPPPPKLGSIPAETQQASGRHSAECTVAARSRHKVLTTVPTFAKAETCGPDHRFLANSGRFRILFQPPHLTALPCLVLVLHLICMPIFRQTGPTLAASYINLGSLKLENQSSCEGQLSEKTPEPSSQQAPQQRGKTPPGFLPQGGN